MKIFRLIMDLISIIIYSIADIAYTVYVLSNVEFVTICNGPILFFIELMLVYIIILTGKDLNDLYKTTRDHMQ